MNPVKVKINRDWYKINNRWYHCCTTADGRRYINGILQEDK